MNGVQLQPRHIPPECTTLDELPNALQGRLSVVTVEGQPPGNDDVGGKAKVPQTFQRLIVTCGPNKDITVNVDYVYYESKYTFQRGNCLWYLCHTWTRTWGEGAKSSTVFINLDTGDRYDVPIMTYWRGTLTISPDGTLVLLTGGIMGSSDAFIKVVDISHLPLVEVIFYEEFLQNVGADFLPDGTLSFSYPFRTSELKNIYLANDPTAECDQCERDADHEWNVVVIRTRNFDCSPHWSNTLELSNVKLVATKYHTDVGIDKMAIISEQLQKVSSDFKTFTNWDIIGSTHRLIINDRVKELISVTTSNVDSTTDDGAEIVLKRKPLPITHSIWVKYSILSTGTTGTQVDTVPEKGTRCYECYPNTTWTSLFKLPQLYPNLYYTVHIRIDNDDVVFMLIPLLG